MSGGAKRPFVGEAPSPSSPSSGGSTKRPRHSASPSYSSTASAASSSPLFPHLHHQTPENLDIAFKRLSSLPAADEYGTPLSHQDENGASTASQLSPHQDEQTVIELDLDGLRLEQAVVEKEIEKKVPSTNQSVVYDTAHWVDLLVREMKEASDVETCRSEVLNILKDLEESIQAVLPKEGAAHSLSKRNFILREENEDYKKKRKSFVNGVICLKERNDVLTQELEQLRLTISQYEERLEKRDENATLIRKDDGISVTLPANPPFHPDGVAGAVTSPHSPSLNMQDELDSIINRLSAIHLGTAAGDGANVENAFSFGASGATYQSLPLGILHWENLLVREMNNDVEACKIGVGKIIEELESLLVTVLPDDEAVDILRKGSCYFSGNGR